MCLVAVPFHARDDWNRDAEAGALADVRRHIDLESKQVGQALDDREAETEALLARAGRLALMKFAEYFVELIRIDDDGNQVGDVLASTVTSITGDYSLALPVGVSLSGNLIVPSPATAAPR